MKAATRFLFSVLTLSLIAFLQPAVSLAQVAVTSADPPSAPQGTVSLDVTVSGSGFDSSAQVEFLLSGTTNPGGITVRKVKVTGSRKLVATIDVAETALIDKFDIQVTLSGGRKGKGTSLFAVLAKPNSDPCAAPNLDFPAFTFRENGINGAPGQERVFVADATGKCARLVHGIVSLASDAMTQVFSYPVAGTTDVGRIVWRQGPDIFAVSFSVSGTSVTPYPMELIFTGVEGVTAVDMSKDGSTVYAALGNPSRVIAINISDHSYTTVYSTTGYIDMIAVDENGVLFVRDPPPYPEPDQIARINPGCVERSCAIVIAEETDRDFRWISYPAASLVDNRLVYERRVVSEQLKCTRLEVISKDGGPVLNAAQPMYGTRSSWYGGKILTNGVQLPRKNGTNCNKTGSISQFDPVTGVETVLMQGYDPDGR